MRKLLNRMVSQSLLATCLRRTWILSHPGCQETWQGRGNIFLRLQKQQTNWIQCLVLNLESVHENKCRKHWGHTLGFCGSTAKLMDPLPPKCHFMIHLIQRALFKGNPCKYGTYRDESFNGLIAKIARACHRRTWANVIHWKCQGLHKKHRNLATAKMFQKSR